MNAADALLLSGKDLPDAAEKLLILKGLRSEDRIAALVALHRRTSAEDTAEPEEQTEESKD